MDEHRHSRADAERAQILGERSARPRQLGARDGACFARHLRQPHDPVETACRAFARSIRTGAAGMP